MRHSLPAPPQPRPQPPTTALLQTLARQRVYVWVRRDLPLPGQPQFDESLRLEPYISLASDGQVLPLFACGSFSYSQSVLTARLAVGRYCSIAKDVAVYGMDHPWERPTTSPFTYSQHELPFWQAARRELGGGRLA